MSVRRSGTRALRSRLTGFPTQRGETNAAHQGLWVNDEAAGIQGWGMQLRPAVRSMRGPVLESAYLDYVDDAPAVDAVTERGDVWSVALHDNLFADRLRLHGEYAASRAVEVHRYGAAQSNSGAAYDLSARYASSPDTGNAFAWELLAERRWADEAFWTRANDEPARGRRVDRLAARVDWGALSGRIGGTRTLHDSDAGDGDREREAITTELVYTDGGLGWLPVVGGILRSPRYRVTLTQSRLIRLQADTLAERRESASLGVGFRPGAWQWGGHYRHSVTHAPDVQGAGRIQRTTRLFAKVPLGGRVAFHPEVNWKMTQARPEAPRSWVMETRLASTATLIPRRLDAEFRIDADRRFAADDSEDIRELALEGRLRWRVRWPPANLPPFTVTVNGRYGHRTDRHGDQRNQARAALEVALPHGFH
ncbi:hypothetical protein [Arhodomonas sp. AD133]|uniref:hypothetical protein n=1 Tax=Arhodomonas sp. AD133 TaxID=3415009 RepID=UPI003EB6BC44